MNIIIKNLYSYVRGVSADDATKVRAHLSFRPSGYQFSPKYKGNGGTWDGTISLFDKWKGRFPTGLVGYLCARLTKEGITPRLLDVRKRPVGTPIKTDLVLRPYQGPVVETAIQTGRGILNLPTASGKTVIASEIIARVGVPTLFLNHTKDLLYQSKAALEHALKQEVGVVGEGVFRPRKVTVGMVQSLYTKADDISLQKYLATVDMLFLDETHHTGSNSWFDVAMAIPAYFRFGLTGTAKREDGANLNLMGATGRIISKIETSTLVKEGYLTRPRIKVYPVPGKMVVTDYQSAYQQGIVDYEPRNRMVADLTWDMMQKDQTVLVLVTRVEHGKALADLIPGAEFLSGSKSGSVRANALERFRKRELLCVVATTIFDEGVDVPVLDSIVFAGGGESDIKTRQRVGRVLRASKGKEYATVVDFLDKHNRYLEDHSNARIAVYKSEPEFQLEIMEAA